MLLYHNKVEPKLGHPIQVGYCDLFAFRSLVRPTFVSYIEARICTSTNDKRVCKIYEFVFFTLW